jgi:hypothetical protein
MKYTSSPFHLLFNQKVANLLLKHFSDSSSPSRFLFKKRQIIKGVKEDQQKEEKYKTFKEKHPHLFTSSSSSSSSLSSSLLEEKKDEKKEMKSDSSSQSPIDGSHFPPLPPFIHSFNSPSSSDILQNKSLPDGWKYAEASNVHKGKTTNRFYY